MSAGAYRTFQSSGGGAAEAADPGKGRRRPRHPCCALYPPHWLPGRLETRATSGRMPERIRPSAQLGAPHSATRSNPLKCTSLTDLRISDGREAQQHQSEEAQREAHDCGLWRWLQEVVAMPGTN